jgi:uncharacterized protein YdaU (DUF1376 family)
LVVAGLEAPVFIAAMVVTEGKEVDENRCDEEVATEVRGKAEKELDEWSVECARSGPRKGEEA